MTLIVFESEVDGFNIGLPENIDIAKDGKRIKMQALDNQWDQSNLVVWTKDGNYYTFDLNYKDQLKEYFHVIKKGLSNYQGDASVENKPVADDPFNVSGSGSTQNELAALKLFTNKLISAKGRYTYLSDEQKKLDLYLDGIFVDDRYFYFKMTIDNRTEILYNVDVVSFTKKAKERKGIAATASTPEIMDIVFANDNGFVSIDPKASVTTVYIVEKFAIDSNYELVIDIFEDNGARDRAITVNEKDINNAKGIHNVID